VGLEISYDPHEAVGLVISRRGVFDASVCEVLMRLLYPGDVAVDGGANIVDKWRARWRAPSGRVAVFLRSSRILSCFADWCVCRRVDPVYGC
jgi:hypothetical protein